MNRGTSVVRFLLRPEARSRGYYRVFVFPSRDMMVAFYDEQCRISPDIGRHRGKRTFEAQVNGWKCEVRKGKKTHCRGQILFHRGFLGAGVVAHEMTHAARYWLGKRLPDERMARIVGRMSAGFWRHWYATAATQ